MVNRTLLSASGNPAKPSTLYSGIMFRVVTAFAKRGAKPDGLGEPEDLVDGFAETLGRTTMRI